MNSQEREIISGIFQRLEQTATQQRDPEAERFIAEKVRQQPYAPYAMAQSLYVQEEAVKSLGQQVEQLQAENERLRQQGPQSGGFLSSIFGGGASRPQPGPSYGRQDGPPPGYGAQQQPGGPWGGGGAPQQGGPWAGQQGGYGMQQTPARGSGFLGSALTTAAGVAGGMVVGNALMNAFSGGHPSLGSTAGLGGGGETLVNNYFGSDAPGGADAGGFQTASYDNDAGGFQDASYDSDLGGGSSDDWT